MVEENGSGASKYTVGQRVVGTPYSSIKGGSGTWQQYIVAKESDLLAVPDDVNDEIAAQVRCSSAAASTLALGVGA